MEECNMMLQLKLLSLTWQTMLNLLGRSDDPLVLTGEAMNQNDVLQEAELENNPPLRVQIYCHQLQLAVYLGDFDLASSLIRHTSCIATVNPGGHAHATSCIAKKHYQGICYQCRRGLHFTTTTNNSNNNHSNNHNYNNNYNNNNNNEVILIMNS
jgi:hypothetical protein